MSQKDRIIAHLKKRRTITPIQALEYYGCFRLAARISELRGDGYKIVTEKIGKKKFAKYRLVA